MKYVLISFLFIMTVTWSYSQEAIYEWKSSIDIPIIISSLGLNTYTLIQEPKTQKPDTEFLRSLSRNQVSSWERSATYNWNENIENWSDLGQNLSVVSPLLLGLSTQVRSEYKMIGLMFLEAMLLNQGIVGTLKVSVLRKRPFVYNEEAPFELKYRRQVFYSFVSGHTSASAAASFFAAKVYGDVYPDSKWKKPIWIGAVILPAVTGYLRYEAGRHFITDVAAGYAIGALIGYFVPHFHRVKKESGLTLRLGSARTDLGLTLNYRI